jgi:hypothetical protein
MQLQDDLSFDWTSPIELPFQNDFHFSNGLDDLVPTQFESFEEFMYSSNNGFFNANSQFEPLRLQGPETFPVHQESSSMQVDSYFDSKFLAQEPLKTECYFMPPTFSHPKVKVETYYPIPPRGSPSSEDHIEVKQEPQPQMPQMPQMPQEKTVPQQFHPSVPDTPREKALSTTLNTNYFNDYCLRTEPSFREHPRLLDVSRPFSGPKYTEIFHQFGSSLLIDKHPQLSENDLSQIERTGFMYFLKNVKTIVPKIGPWKFQSHVRGSSASQPYDTDRSYNLVGSRVSIRCKVKEWVCGNDLWRMYHYVQGKSSKPARMV